MVSFCKFNNFSYGNFGNFRKVNLVTSVTSGSLFYGFGIFGFEALNLIYGLTPLFNSD